METVVHWLTKGIEAFGITVIVGGAILATILFARRLASREDFNDIYKGYRADLGRGILLGLEFLVAADIIRTVLVDLTFLQSGYPRLIILIRTFPSFALEVEISGKLPWQKEN